MGEKKLGWETAYFKSASLLTFFRDWKKVSARAAWAQGKDIEEANPKKYKLTIKQLN